MAFHVGQRVVCVDASPTRGRWQKSLFGLRKTWVSDGTDLRKGAIYTIARSAMGTNLVTGENEPWVQLCEILPPPHQPHGGYAARRFRPLDEARLDQFRAHLAPVPKSKVSA